MADKILIAVDAERLDRIEAAIAALSERLDRPKVEPIPEWMPVSKYAELAGVTQRTVRNWIEKGEIETRRNGSRVLVRISPNA